MTTVKEMVESILTYDKRKADPPGWETWSKSDKQDFVQEQVNGLSNYELLELISSAINRTYMRR